MPSRPVAAFDRACETWRGSTTVTSADPIGEHVRRHVGLLAVLDASDAAHRVADRTWRRLIESDEQLVSTNYVLVEAFALVQSRLGLSAVRVLAEDIVPLLQIEWLSAGEHKAAVKALLSANRRKLSLVDCTSFGCMRSLGLRQAFAFDADFAKEGFESAT